MFGILLLRKPLLELLEATIFQTFGQTPELLSNLMSNLLAAQIATAPIIVSTFGEVPALVVLTNLIAVPLSGPILTLGLLASLVGNVAPAVAYPLNFANGFLGTILEWTAQAVASLPFAVVETPGVPLALIGLFYLGCVPAAISESVIREERRPFWAGMLVVWTHSGWRSSLSLAVRIPSMTVYLLLGDDEERKARGVERLRRDRSVKILDATEDSPEAVISACNSYDLFGEGPFVLLRNLDAWNAAQKAKIVAYLESPSTDTDLVLLGRKLGAREKLLSAVKKAGEVHNLEQPTGKALVKWVVVNAEKKGLDLPDEVAQSLTDRCSGDKSRLVREIEKLSLYIHDRPATVEDVQALCPPDLQSNIFAFVDSLVSGQQGRALELLEELLASGEPPLKITYMIRRQFLLAARARALLNKEVPQREIAKDLKVPPFVVRKLDEQARKLGQDGAEQALERVVRLESDLKGTGDFDDGLQIELATLNLSRRV